MFQALQELERHEAGFILLEPAGPRCMSYKEGCRLLDRAVDLGDVHREMEQMARELVDEMEQVQAKRLERREQPREN